MSSITNLSSSGYYQLNNSSTGSQSQTSGTSTTQSLISALNGTSSTNGPNTDSAYMLNLSPQAKAYINSQNATGTNTTASLLNSLTGSGSSNSASGTALGASQNFTLSANQQQKITDILTKYKDAPYTQDTYNKIQNDLNKAGLGSNTLMMEDKAKTFNAPLVLINALNGGNSSDTGVTSDSDEQAKASSYMQGIISQWKNISGNAATATSSTYDSSGSATGNSANTVAPVASTGEA